MENEQIERATAATLNGLNRRLNTLQKRKEDNRLEFEKKQQELTDEITRLNQEIALVSVHLKGQIAQKSSLDCKQLQDAIDEYMLSHPEIFDNSLKIKAKQRLQLRKKSQGKVLSADEQLEEQTAPQAEQ